MPAPHSLLSWVEAPEAFPSPLAPLRTARTRHKGWPVGLLPLELLARDLTSLYRLTYRSRRGFDSLRLPVSDHEVVRRSGVILEIAAERLAGPLPSEVLAENLAELYAEIDRAQEHAHSTIDDYMRAELIGDAESVGALALAPRIADRLADPGLLALDREHAARAPLWREHADALRRTALDLRASQAAQNHLLRALRRELAEPDSDCPPGESPAIVWLSSLDSLPRVLRSDLSRLYDSAGRPGALSKSELLALADSRWGKAKRTTGGHYVYRPALAA